ncbi:MAG: GGDEF domain-containing protein [Holosporaceae bacterium]|jgi:diguanylate cyclase (GGDEF)-like protein|nr:GGDEF domain-containing protein [Holosporaceae bacterium]
MVARILIVNECKQEISKISEKLQNSYNMLMFSKSMEDAIRIVGTQLVDLAIVSIPTNCSKLFFDFFSVLRQLCGVIPIIGMIEKNTHTDLLKFSQGIDDVVDIDIGVNALRRKIEMLITTKNLFNDSLLSNVYIAERRAQKIVSFFHDNLDFIHDSIRHRAEIIQPKSWPTIDDVSDADLFLINSAHSQACSCCSALRLKRINRYKPIVLTYDEGCKAKIKLYSSMNIGYTDALSRATDPQALACRLNSLMKYKKLYENFTEKLKKSIYMSAVDSTTEVYNRSFFEDYIGSKDRQFVRSAVLIIDVDKFKLVNDVHGHAFADLMLKYVSSTIKKFVRSSDLIARYGGDEFVIIMDNVTKNMASEIANRIRRSVENSPFRNITSTVSVGVCCIDADSHLGITDAVSIADKFMYIAKQNGGNAVNVCE